MIKTADENLNLYRRPYRRSSFAAGGWVFVLSLGLMMILFLPIWPYSLAWGYYPASGVALLSLLFFVLFVGGALVVTEEDKENHS